MVIPYIRHRQEKKKVRFALRKMFGIGRHISGQICNRLGISNQTIRQLRSSVIDDLSFVIATDYYIAHELKRIIRKDVKHLIDVNCFRARYHKLSRKKSSSRNQKNRNSSNQKNRGQIKGWRPYKKP